MLIVFPLRAVCIGRSEDPENLGCLILAFGPPEFQQKRHVVAGHNHLGKR
jgi:hypothetical protein